MAADVAFHAIAWDGNKPCPGGKHIPGAKVEVSGWWGFLFCANPVNVAGVTNENGIFLERFDPTPGCFDFTVRVTTPQGKVGTATFRGGEAFASRFDFYIGVPGSCGEGDAGADAGAALDELGPVLKAAAIIGIFALGGYIAYRVLRRRGQ